MGKRLLWAFGLCSFVWMLLPVSAQTVISNNAADMANHIVMVADSTTPRTVTNLFTFDRGASAPFAVNATATKVSNLDADKLDSQDGTYYTNAANLTGTIAAISGANVTSLNASNLSSGTVPVARLGNGTTTALTSTTTSNQNNWAPGLVGNTVITWSGAGDITITGFAGGVSGQTVTFINTGSNVASFAHQSGSSSAGNKFRNAATSAATPVAGGGSVVYQYDGTDWRMVAHEQGGWVSYGATSTISGWSSRTTTSIYYELSGRTLTVNFYLDGTSNSTGTSFTIPFTSVSGPTFLTALGRTFDNGAYPTAGGSVSIGSASSTLTVFKSNDATATWTAANQKIVSGSFSFEVQ